MGAAAAVVCVLAFARAGLASGQRAAVGGRPAVVALLEDNADTLLPLLTNPTGDPGEGHVERVNVFSGRSAVRIVPLQRFEPHIPGWNYRIVEKPAAAGEYRFVRWAWKADGCAGTMVQFHIETGWSVRYCAGNNDPGWGTRFVAPDPPAGWVVVTRDLFADFGQCTVTGIAMAAFRGRGAYFDHAYFGRTRDDLDRIDATGLRDRPPPRLGAGDLGRLWGELGDADPSRAYLAFWTLVAVPDRSVPFLREALAPSPSASPELLKQVTGWIADLEATDVAAREEATRRLADHAAAAEQLLRERFDDVGPESRARIDALLRSAGAGERGDARVERAVRVLEYVGTPQALTLLGELSRGDPASAVTRLATEALTRARGE